MLRALGGAEVQLRFATPASSSTADPRLGLAETGCEDVAISPVVVRCPASNAAAGAKTEMLFAASSIAKQLELRAFDSGEALFNAAIAIVHRGRTYQFASVSTDSYGGTPYLYRVMVTA